MSQSRLSIIKMCLISLAMLLPVSSMADEPPPAFTQDRFEALQQEGAVILVDVWASWCPTCRAQGEVLSDLLSEEDFAEVKKLRLDWDEQKEHAESLDAWRQSTLILYRGENEMARVVAETRESALRNFLEAAL
ncbi:thioredoxin family protein [Gammaproteobacteria bacterium AB-CW1]|uniref:Thioredoxin family protein n=1 Tax=Natronospira elongata TaxID=3110268 RepID=A0AAP6JGW8_9GAMM|nr:thioredoxin family protein [Gammaproteobacteria bacterium AB-CW1]